ETFDLTVMPRPPDPSVTPAATIEDVPTTSGLVITKNPVGSDAITLFRIVGITGGTLFQHDATTPIVEGEFISLAQGAAGLRFTPSPNFNGIATFLVQSAVGADGSRSLSALAAVTVTAV